jgi:hypothetical protein
VKVITSAWLYQPFESGGRPGVEVTTGPVASYWSEKTFTVVFPARSTHDPETEAFPESGPA